MHKYTTKKNRITKILIKDADSNPQKTNNQTYEDDQS